METSRKRPYVDDEDTLTTKKRVLSGPNGSPHVNGLVTEQDEPTDADTLELFRKEAIYRRMRHYSREHERSKARVAELEQRKHACEAGLAAMTACWNQLVQMIRILVNTDGIPQVADEEFDFTVYFREYNRLDFSKALEKSMNATQTLVTKLVETRGDPPVLDGASLMECHRTAADRVSLQSQLDLAYSQIVDVENQRDQFHAALIIAENRLDRLRSSTVSNTQPPNVEIKRDTPEDVIEGPQRKPSSPAGSKSPTGANGIYDPSEVDTLREQVASRESKINDLEQEISLSREERLRLETELKTLSYEKVVEHPYYKALAEYCGSLQATASERQEQIDRILEELSSERASKKDWEEEVNNIANQANQELRAALAKRDVENSRLRAQRDQQAAELSERKQQDCNKTLSVHELQTLAESRAERIVALESEVSRCKALLAAHAGQKELMMFFMDGNIDEANYIASLKTKITAAENRVITLEEALSKHQTSDPNAAELITAEVTTLERLSDVEAQLKQYKTRYGDYSSQTSGTLEEQLRLKDEEVQTLRLLDIQHAQAEASLYTEVDKLSAAWESLDKQVKNKVFDLSAMESQLKKAVSEKAKSDNKYFAVMREKDAITAEHGKLVRDAEKQSKVIERLVDIEKNLTVQLANLEKELMTAKSLTNLYKNKSDSQNAEISLFTQRYAAEKRKVDEVVAAFQEQERVNIAKRTELRRLEDGLLRTKNDFESKLKYREVTAIRDGEKESEQLLKLLKCSTCRTEFRNTVITKCMHTFCRTCIDARISTRQRKCPACSLTFSQSDVLGMYFQ